MIGQGAVEFFEDGSGFLDPAAALGEARFGEEGE